LSHFAAWLTMNYFLVLEKIIVGILGQNAFSLRLVPLTAGVSVIPLTAVLAMRFTSRRTAMVAATLVALNPYLIDFSVIIRAYSLLTALSLALLIAAFWWRDAPSYRRGLAVAAIAYLLVLSHPNGAYPLAYIIFMLAMDVFSTSSRTTTLRTLPSLLVPLSTAVVLAILSYVKIFPEMIQFGRAWHDTPPTSIDYFPFIFTQYFSEGFFAWPSALCFITGIFIACKYEKPVARALPFILLPMLLMSLQGSSTFPWAFGRFLIFIVPVIIIFVAEGCDYFVNRLFPAHSFRMTVSAVLILVLSWLPHAYAIADEQKNNPWHRVAAYLKEHVRQGDIILGSSWREVFHFRPYFPETSEVGPFQLDESSLRIDALKSGTGTVYFVAPTQPTAVPSPGRTFGRIQVIPYQPSGGESALRLIRDDLVRTVQNGDELTPGFAPLYKNIWDINNALGGEAAGKNFHYYNLMMKCQELSRRQRNIPYNLQRWEAQMFLKSLK